MKYYTLIGSNGVGIYTDYDLLKESRMYVKHSKFQGFLSYDDSYDWILAYADFPMVCEIPDKFPLNYTIYFKNII